jgi:hypothetical protein
LSIPDLHSQLPYLPKYSFDILPIFCYTISCQTTTLTAKGQQLMTTLLIKNAYIVTMDDHQREIPEGGLFIRGGIIEEMGYFPIKKLRVKNSEAITPSCGK